MSSFKLLAIIPLKGCHEDIRKNLKEGTVYKFYNNYSINTSDDFTEIIYACKESEESNPYKINDKLKLNIHAVVGENGSGKSSLFELYYYFIYLFGCMNTLDNKNRILSPVDQELLFKQKKIKEQISRLYEYPLNLDQNHRKPFSHSQLNDVIEISKEHGIDIPSEILLKNTKSLNNFFSIQLFSKEKEYKIRIDNQTREFQKIKEQVSCSIVFEINDTIFDFSYHNSEFSSYKFNQDGTKKKLNEFFLEDYFYTVSLNYSHHSLNSLTIGSWINKLFHKNDAYITPVVINPMRDKGNFNINDELHLSKERIMMNIISNLLLDKDYKILDKYKVKRLIYRLKENISPIKNFKFYDLTEQYTELLKYEWQLKHLKEEFSLTDYAIGYLKSKIEKLKRQYGPIFLDKIETEDMEVLEKNLDDITKKLVLTDFSHITKKIGQTINFIKNYGLGNWNVEKNDDKKRIEVELDLDQLKDWVEKCNPRYLKEDSFELSILAHPGIFNVDFILETEDEKELLLSELSSGEQQLLFNINTIIYHINNLNSVHKNVDKDEIKRPRYKNLNIVLDEIELYYHPEYQRQFIQTLIKELDKFSMNIDLEDRIETINLCFLTHSPFILSDIPTNNVLRLNDGSPVPFQNESNTFGANIHDLLANDFFLENGFIGEFAKGIIQTVIDNLQMDKTIIPKKQLEKEEIIQIVEIIGEPFLKDKLMEMYKLKFKEDDLLNAEIEKLKNRIQKYEKLKSKRNDPDKN